MMTLLLRRTLRDPPAPVELPAELPEDNLIRNIVTSLRSDLRIGVFSLFANTIGGSALVPRLLRVPILRALGIRVGRAHVRPEVKFTTRDVTIGNRAMVNRGCLFDSQGGIFLGDRVHLGYEVALCTSTHAMGPPAQRAAASEVAPIRVGDGTWIGARAVVLPGVTIGRGCVIAAGAVVTRDCLPNGVYAGVPAKRLRDLA